MIHSYRKRKKPKKLQLIDSSGTAWGSEREYDENRSAFMAKHNLDLDPIVEILFKGIPGEDHKLRERILEDYFYPIDDLAKLKERQEVVRQISDNPELAKRLEKMALVAPTIKIWDSEFFKERSSGRGFWRDIGDLEELVTLSQEINSDSLHPELKEIVRFGREIADDLAYKELIRTKKKYDFLYDKVKGELFPEFATSGTVQTREAAMRAIELFARTFKPEKLKPGEITRTILDHVEVRTEIFNALDKVYRTVERLLEEDGDFSPELRDLDVKKELELARKRLASSNWLRNSSREELEHLADPFYLEGLTRLCEQVNYSAQRDLQGSMRKVQISLNGEKDSGNLAGDLSLYISLAKTKEAFQEKGVKTCLPEFREESGEEQEISEGMVPSLILRDKKVVPNDIYSSERERVFTIEGPNDNGKTTYLRMIGQMHYLAQLGAFLPAKSARMSPIDNMFLSISKSDSPQKGEGTYKAQLKFIRGIFSPIPPEIRRVTREDEYTGRHFEEYAPRYAESYRGFPIVTPRSLLLFDEMAIGTDSKETARRNLVILDEIAARGSTVYLPTHSHELCDKIHSGAISCGLNLAAKVEKDKDGKLVYLRKIVRKEREESYGEVLAEEEGITPEVLARGRIILKL